MSLFYLSGWFMAIGLVGRPATADTTSKQGIEGFVYRISGNQMPSPDVKPAAPKGISTTLYIFELTSVGQTSRQGHTAFYSAIHTRLVKKIQTDSTGHFQVQLPAGQYSLFTKKGDLYYANSFDGEQHIAPTTVEPGKMTSVEVRMDFDAFY